MEKYQLIKGYLETEVQNNNMTEVNIVRIATTTFGAFLIGGLCGGVARYLLKVVGFLIGISIAILAYLDFIDYVKINWKLIRNDINTIVGSIKNLGIPEGDSATQFYETNGIVFGFIIGLIVGFKIA